MFKGAKRMTYKNEICGSCRHEDFCHRGIKRKGRCSAQVGHTGNKDGSGVSHCPCKKFKPQSPSPQKGLRPTRGQKTKNG